MGKIVFKFAETFCCTCSILYILVPVRNGRSLIRGWHKTVSILYIHNAAMILLGSKERVSTVEECYKSMANFKPTQYPRQESEDDRDTNEKLKPNAGIPRQDEHAEGTKGRAQAEFNATPDVHVSSQGQDSDVNDEMRNQVIVSPAKRETVKFCIEQVGKCQIFTVKG